MSRHMQPIIIRRQRKYDVEQDIKDLEARGFEVISPLKQQNPQSEVLHNLSFEQRRFKVEDFSSPWIAKLRRIEE
ncbi:MULTISPECIES: hypothetical protein [unclassified Peribacillus]|uniref:hypothetical protein n=1 Tax=unclassified Peribacillus TaxID=2675266 RepID=UPI001911A2B1|nr:MULTISPECIES: hypothetical protein [unclassified Peribacillus]MBK5459199.1 hypothetical protein [Peribacillus sp. TH27]MBK5481020.1 hypothetical protein [Peribacillus sp. TH16]MBK5497344.1 hypothetical protein [Peribacillus sp. TH14]WMX57511.1 hypothetical protein RE409_09975 [Peribacillus sp. R9-11]